MRCLLITLITLIFALAGLQAGAQGSLHGTVVDSASRRPLALATISVFRSDTSLLTYRISDESGRFTVPNLPHVPGYFVISFSGYEVYRASLDFSAGERIELDTIRLQPTSRALDEILVVAERPPVRVYHDTVEFNAASFRTLPTALLEDLLKKFPGVQVDGEGGITVNGKSVNRILVDGKQFFGSDPKMATRNLPANIIDKVQVMDDQQEVERTLNGDLTQVGKVINLTLRKGIRKGWFGRFYGGYGTDDRYETGGIANIYRDTLQLSVLAYSNNINRAGFTLQDISNLGGFSRSGINSLNILKKNGTEGFAVNGISFGGLDEGLATSSGAGFNLNHVPNKRFSFFTQYFYGNNRNRLVTRDEVQQFLSDTTVTTATATESSKHLFTHVLNVGLDLNPTSYFSTTFRASGNYQQNRSDAASSIATVNNKVGLVSTGNGELRTRLYTGDYTHNLHFVIKSKSRRGRIINIDHRLDTRSDLRRNTTETANTYFYPVADTVFFNQLRRQETPALLANVQVSLAEPLSKKWTFRFNDTYDHLRERQGVSIYDRDPFNGLYEVALPGQGGDLQRIQDRNNANASLSYTAGVLNINAGLSLLNQHIDNRFETVSIKNTSRISWLLPNFFISWKNLSLGYSESVTVPDIQFLNPVRDSTNPFYIITGNPQLRPAHSRSANLNFFRYDGKHNVITSFYLRGSLRDNDAILSRTVDADGVQTVFPINASGTTQYAAGATLGKEHKEEKYSLSFGLSPYINYSHSRIVVNSRSAFASTYDWGPKMYIRFNLHDLIEVNTTYGLAISRTVYTNNLFNTIQATTQNLQADVLIHFSRRLTGQTNLLYRHNSETFSGLYNNSILWNAALAVSVLKNNKGQLKLSVYDILNSNNNFSRQTRENIIADHFVNVLSRYGLLTFVYNLQNLGGDQAPKERGRLFLF